MLWYWQSIVAGASRKSLSISSSEIMKRLLIQVVIFIIPLVILAVGVEIFARTIPNTYRFKKEWMDNNSREVKTLILGNSHLNSAIIPSQMDSTFNLTNSSQSLEYDSWLLSMWP